MAHFLKKNYNFFESVSKQFKIYWNSIVNF